MYTEIFSFLFGNKLFDARAEIACIRYSRQSDTNFAISLMLFVAALISLRKSISGDNL